MLSAGQEPVPGGGTAAAAVAGRDVQSVTKLFADRMAAALARREPGWRLPKHTVLARRYGASVAEIQAALEELAARRLIRRQPDGQLYRASPIQQLIPLEGVPGLGTLADPMGGQLVCRSRQASLTAVPEDIGWALCVPPADQLCVIRTEWATAYGGPAAFSTMYLLRDVAAPFLDGGRFSDTAIGQPGSVRVELQPPPPALARQLGLSAGQPAALVTTRFDDPDQRRPVALATTALRPDLFRIVVQANRPLAE